MMTRLQQSVQTINAVRYIEHNLKVQIIAHHTQLSAKYLRALIKEQTGEPPKSGRLITIPRLFRSKRATCACILFLSIYTLAYVENSTEVELELLIKAYSQYAKHSADIATLSKENLLSINDAWVLIQAYLNKTVELELCLCGVARVVSQTYDLNETCPFCESLTQSYCSLNRLKSVSVS